MAKEKMGKKEFNMELGIIGLGKMRGNLALQCIAKGIRVVGKPRRAKPTSKRRAFRLWKTMTNS